jgi:hypothetical protein
MKFIALAGAAAFSDVTPIIGWGTIADHAAQTVSILSIPRRR